MLELAHPRLFLVSGLGTENPVSLPDPLALGRARFLHHYCASIVLCSLHALHALHVTSSEIALSLGLLVLLECLGSLPAPPESPLLCPHTAPCTCCILWSTLDSRHSTSSDPPPTGPHPTTPLTLLQSTPTHKHNLSISTSVRASSSRARAELHPSIHASHLSISSRTRTRSSSSSARP